MIFCVNKNVSVRSSRVASEGRFAALLLPTLLIVSFFISGSQSVAVGQTAYYWLVKGNIESAPLEEGVFTAGKAAQKLVVEPSVSENQRWEFDVRLSRPGWINLMTGRGRESLEIGMARQGEDYLLNTRFIAADGEVFARKRVSFSNPGNPTFGWTDQMLLWQRYFDSLAAENRPEKRWFKLGFELRSGHGRFLLDGHLLHEWKADDDLYGRNLTLFVGADAQARLPVVSELEPARPDQVAIDISASYNSIGLAGQRLSKDSLPVEREFEVDGTLFYIGSANKSGYDNLDIGRSWFREANSTSYEAPHRGSFGGRWSGFSSGNPSRFQFPVPQRDIVALHLLAASEDTAHSIPHVTAQFFRPGAGFPKNFRSPEVPLATVQSTSHSSYPVETEGGQSLNLWKITIPIDTDLLQEFNDLDIVEVELTKDVQVYRAYPDPNHYSTHAAGLPSAVRVFAMTVEKAPFGVKFEPEALGNVWVANKPAYIVEVGERLGETAEVKVVLQSRSYDRAETNAVSHTLSLEPNEWKRVRMELDVDKFGHHDVILTVSDSRHSQSLSRSFSRLRRRDYAARPYDTKGFMFGYWNWRGSHHTPDEKTELELMGKLGMESTGPNGGTIATQQDTMAIARRYGMRSFWGGQRGSVAKDYVNNPDSITEVEDKWRAYGYPPTTPTHEPTYINIFAEPGGTGTHGVLPEFYGEPPFEMNEAQQKAYDRVHAAALASIKVAKAWNPDVKILFPWGDPVFAVPYLKANDELTKLMDGVGVDIGYFDRMPEMQMHQCAIHRIYQFTTYWKQYKDKDPVWPCVEGPCIGQIMPGSLTRQQHAENFVRSSLILAAYGVNRQFAMGSLADCAGWWGEQHYGGGMMSRLDGLNPHPTYSALGTLIRHLRYMEFVGWIPTGSLSAYALHFRDSRDDKNLYVMWTLRGRRSVNATAPRGSVGEVYDDMDNMTRIRADEKGLTFNITTTPRFVYLPESDPKFLLGEPDHSDVVLSPFNLTLGNVSDLFNTQGDDADPEYVDSFPDAIRRFYAEMEIEQVDAPKEYGGRAVSVKLPEQEKDRGVMPFYTALKPSAPVAIPGKGQYVSMWIRAASDWGRVVYVLRDAKGEKWVSVGSMGQWNCDDTPAASSFNFDGWRLVRFELPAHSPYDTFREMGTTWWGATEGDNVVDLPLSIEKIFIERRPKAMYVNSLEKTDQSPVLLGDLLIEYATAEDQRESIVELSKVRMDSPPTDTGLINPIEELAARGTLPPTAITAVDHPDHYYDGTRGIFKFNEVESAVDYDIWLSLDADGNGALRLGSGLKSSGALVKGFRADVVFHAFVVYRDKAGETSKPSKPFKFTLDNQFGMR